MMPLDLYSTKKLQNIDLLMHLLNFRNNYFKKIYSDASIIHKALYKILNEIEYTANEWEYQQKHL